MTLYTNRNKSPFLFIAASLFLMMLLMIPLRPSKWQKNNEPLKADSLTVNKNQVITKIRIVSDTQKIILPATDSNSTDTSYTVIYKELIDTIRTENNPTIISSDSIDTVAIQADDKQVIADYSALFTLIKYLLLICLLFGGAAYLFIRLFSSKLKKKYWIQYSSQLQTMKLPAAVSENTAIDFSDINQIFESEINPPLKKGDQKKDTNLNLEEDYEDLNLKAAEKKTEANKILTTEIKKEKKSVEPKASITTTSFTELLLIKILFEIISRTPRILFAICLGFWKIVRYFFRDNNEKSKAIDFKWHDAVSIFTVTLSILSLNVFFPYQTSLFSGYILALSFLWIVPAIIRFHWSLAVLGIVLWFAEITGMIVYAITEATKGQVKTDDNTLYYIIGTLSAVAVLYWLKKKNKLPVIKTILPYMVAGACAYLLTFTYFAHEYFITFFEYGGPGDIAVRILLIYLSYEIAAVIIRLFSFSLLPDEELADVKLEQAIKKHQKEDKVTIQRKNIASPDFNKKNWFKKTELSRLYEINMSSSHLSEESEFIVLYLPDCINTKNLILSDNEFEHFPFEITELEMLEELDLSGNKLGSIISEIEFLEKLKVLNLSDNELSELPEEIKELKQLQILNLKGNPVSEQTKIKLSLLLPNTEIVYDVVEEETEYSRDEQLIRELLEEELKEPENVISIWGKLNNKGFTELPESIFSQFINLEKLSLFQNELKELPPVIYKLKKLKNLNLGYNQINIISDELGKLTNLETITLHGNPLVYLSDKCLSLINLFYDNSDLPIIPDFIFNLKSLKNLSLVSNNLKLIPEEIANLENLEILSLGHNQIGTSIRDLRHLPVLKHLNLNGMNYNNQYTPVDLNELESLESLSLSHNKYKKIPKEVFKLNNLRVLTIVDNNLKGLSSKISQLTKLEYLNLYKNNISTIPEEIKELKNLNLLSLKGNPISKKTYGKLRQWLPNTEIRIDENNNPVENPSAIISKKEVAKSKLEELLNKELKNPLSVKFISSLIGKKLKNLPEKTIRRFYHLRVLLLNGNLFEKLPESIYSLENLETLVISNNKIREIPSGISNLKNLIEIDLSNNPLQNLPAELSKLENIERINLSNCGLKVFPAVLFNMPDLKSINLNGNNIKKIPAKIRDLKHLQELNMDFTGISIIPENILELNSLKILNWSGNKLMKLPNELSELKNLEKLSISYNRDIIIDSGFSSSFSKLISFNIAGINKSIRDINFDELKNLLHLNLSDNNLSELPKELINLTELKTLNLSGNQLKEINIDLSLFKNIENLFLSRNILTKLPEGLKELKSLNKIDLRNNELSTKEKNHIQDILPGVIIEI